MKDILFTVLIIVLSSCYPKAKREAKNEDSSFITIKFDSTSHSISGSEIDSNYAIRCRMLKIENLRIGKNIDTEIRIWIDSYSLGDTARVLILKGNGTNWAGAFHGYRFGVTERGENYVLSHNIENGTPRSGWKKYLEKVENAGLNSLNSMNLSQNSALCTGGPGIEVEIAEKGRYKRYIYPCWDLIKDQTQLDKIQNILRLTEDQFGFRIYPIAPTEAATVTSSPPIEFSDIEIKEKAK